MKMNSIVRRQSDQKNIKNIFNIKTISFIALVLHIIIYLISFKCYQQIEYKTFTKHKIPALTICTSHFNINNLSWSEDNNHERYEIIEKHFKNKTFNKIIKTIQPFFWVNTTGDNCLIATFESEWLNCDFEHENIKKFISFNSKKNNNPSFCKTYFYKNDRIIDSFETKNNLYYLQINDLSEGSLDYIKIFFHVNSELASDYFFEYDKFYFGNKYFVVIHLEKIIYSNKECGKNDSNTQCNMKCLYKNITCLPKFYLADLEYGEYNYCDSNNLDKNFILNCFKSCEEAICEKHYYSIRTTQIKLKNPKFSNTIKLHVISNPLPLKIIRIYCNLTYIDVLTLIVTLASTYIGFSVNLLFEYVYIFLKKILSNSG